MFVRNIRILLGNRVQHDSNLLRIVLLHNVDIILQLETRQTQQRNRSGNSDDSLLQQRVILFQMAILRIFLRGVLENDFYRLKSQRSCFIYSLHHQRFYKEFRLLLRRFFYVLFSTRYDPNTSLLLSRRQAMVFSPQFQLSFFLLLQ